MNPRQVTVVIAAHNAGGTLLRAIGSALCQTESVQVFVVDDASTDDTRSVARKAAEADARVSVIAFEVNRGPAAARNVGLDAATGEFVAILDSDDIFLPGRLAMLLTGDPGDLTADNIAFVDAEHAERAGQRQIGKSAALFTSVGTAEFVRGNLMRSDVARNELGFLKPILRTSFLREHGLRYDERLRLAEDYDLYVRMLLAGARFRLTRTPGYVAVVRGDSLSAQHGARDLASLHEAIEAHLNLDGVTPQTEEVMRLHRDQVRAKRDHRVFLDLRRAEGPMAAIRYAFGARNRAVHIALAIARDKLRLSPSAGDAVRSGDVRLLLPEIGPAGR